MIRKKIILEVEINESLKNQLEAFISDYGTDVEHIISRALPLYFKTINH
mgnify:FL=1